MAPTWRTTSTSRRAARPVLPNGPRCLRTKLRFGLRSGHASRWKWPLRFGVQAKTTTVAVQQPGLACNSACMAHQQQSNLPMTAFTGAHLHRGECGPQGRGAPQGVARGPRAVMQPTLLFDFRFRSQASASSKRQPSMVVGGWIVALQSAAVARTAAGTRCCEASPWKLTRLMASA